MHIKHALDDSRNDQLVVIQSPSSNTDVNAMTIVHHPTEQVILDNGNGQSRRKIMSMSNYVIILPHFSAKEKLLLGRKPV